MDLCYYCGRMNKMSKGKLINNSNGSSKSIVKAPLWVLFTACFLFIFGIVVFLLSRNLGEIDEAVGKAAAGLSSLDSPSSSTFALRTLTIQSKFAIDVSLYYEDGMAGSFLTNINALATAQISAATGHVIYATEQTGWTRIATIAIRAGQDIYTLSPTHTTTTLEDATAAAAAASKSAAVLNSNHNNHNKDNNEVVRSIQEEVVPNKVRAFTPALYSTNN